MLIVMRPQATKAQIAAVVGKIHALGSTPTRSRRAATAIGHHRQPRPRSTAEAFASLPGVADRHPRVRSPSSWCRAR